MTYHQFSNQFYEGALEKLAYGYNLDCGGYSFEDAAIVYPGLFDRPVAIWDDFKHDYFPFNADAFDCSYLLAFAPLEVFQVFDPETWPKRLPGYALVEYGAVAGSDRDCQCHGVWDEGAWVTTSNVMDDPYPECPRCGGEGSVESPAGAWAIYAPVES